MATPLQQDDEIIEALLRVETSKIRVSDPNGENPACKNALLTYTCERCGGDVRENRGACPAVPSEQRWHAVTDDELAEGRH